ncbi:MAG: DUF4190 domain-containing protein, partial [Phycisphaerae bacterium]
MNLPIEPTPSYTPNHTGADIPARLSGLAITSMVLGILSFVLCLFTGLPAIILGIRALAKINAAPQRYGGIGYARVGIITGIVGSLFFSGLMYLRLGPSKEMANRSRCAANLCGNLKTCLVYAAENNNVFPVTVGSSDESGTRSYSVPNGPAISSGLTNAKIVLSAERRGMYAAPQNDPTACLWILVLQNQ